MRKKIAKDKIKLTQGKTIAKDERKIVELMELVKD
jgi:hypothetical protein